MADRQKLRAAMQQPERWVLRLVYVDDLGRKTRRVVSPVRFGRGSGLERFKTFLALCLCRQDHRWFKTAACHNIELVPAADVLMPTEIEEL